MQVVITTCYMHTHPLISLLSVDATVQRFNFHALDILWVTQFPKTYIEIQ